VMRRSRSRLRGNYRHTRGIILDIFYDHLLSVHWQRFCSISLPQFTRNLYEQGARQMSTLPPCGRDAMSWMIREDRLASYGTREGVESALRDISARLQRRLDRPFALHLAVPELFEQFRAFESDFTEFFPQIQAHFVKNFAQ